MYFFVARFFCNFSWIVHPRKMALSQKLNMSSERMLQCGINPHAKKTLAHLLPLVYYLQAELEVIGKILSCLSQEPPGPFNMALYMPSLYSSRVLIGLPDRPRVLLLSLSPTHSCLCRAAQKTKVSVRLRKGLIEVSI